MLTIQSKQLCSLPNFVFYYSLFYLCYIQSQFVTRAKIEEFNHIADAKARRNGLLGHQQQFHDNLFSNHHGRVRRATNEAHLGKEQLKRSKRGYANKHRPVNGIDEQVESRPVVNVNDPIFDKQWYLLNTGQAGGKPGLDLNVVDAWEQGYTGKGVTVAIMDDGLDYLHPDLAPNYNAEASYDFSSDDPYPYPRYTDDWFNSHGTRCAGEVVGVANNGICGVGIAYNARIAGIRMLDQPFMTDTIEALSMSHRSDLIDIYSASWGPTDDGRTVDGPREYTIKAMAHGVNKGRNGKGSIYVWASGDGGKNDDCNCDGYASSMWTISINSAINDGRTALYDESCSSTLASTFSNGRSLNPEAGVATTDLYGNCTLRHSGTSAAAPEAAGVFALALEANPGITWRDMQHLVVITSKRNKLNDELHKWKTNGRGLEYNHLFGFGVLDAGAIVREAKDWTTVPERFHCVAAVTTEPAYPIPPPGEVLTIELTTDACAGQENEVRYVEHVQAIVTTRASRRGDLTINMTSPSGTESILLAKRPYDDDSQQGFQEWPFLTTHTWGENPVGQWILTVELKSDQFQQGELLEWKLVVHGTQEDFISTHKAELQAKREDAILANKKDNLDA
jgi:proprotein convertase subtilisin/kexin type 2